MFRPTWPLATHCADAATCEQARVLLATLDAAPFETVEAAASDARLEITPSAGPAEAPTRVASQSYALSITADGVRLSGPPDGLRLGLVTLVQLAQLAPLAWPAVRIADWPDFVQRGVSLDISRGRVPRLETLQETFRRFALLKLNHVELYTEHTFDFAFDGDIGAGSDPLTADDIGQLDDYAAKLGIELTPSLASFGHMGRVLSLPQYRDLAEIPPERDFTDMTWRQRMHGLTLDASNPRSRALLTQMYDAYLPLFRSSRMNVSCDETYDLGRGRGAARAAEIGAHGLLREHLVFLHDLCGKHGKQMMFWADMVLQHPEILAELPRDAVALHWTYTRDSDYAAGQRFCDAGLETWCCPGVWSWNMFVNNINLAEANISQHAAVGSSYGATGMLNTEWGDEGHVTPLAPSWHPFALGAELAWRANGRTGAAFDRVLAAHCLGRADAAPFAALRAAVAAAPEMRIWPAVYASLRDDRAFSELTPEHFAAWESAAELALGAWAGLKPASGGSALRFTTDDLDEMRVALQLHGAGARRLRAHRRSSDGAAGAAEWTGIAEDFSMIAEPYATAWRRRHRAARLDDVLRAFSRLAEEARERARSV